MLIYLQYRAVEQPVGLVACRRLAAGGLATLQRGDSTVGCEPHPRVIDVTPMGLVRTSGGTIWETLLMSQVPAGTDAMDINLIDEVRHLTPRVQRKPGEWTGEARPPRVAPAPWMRSVEAIPVTTARGENSASTPFAASTDQSNVYRRIIGPYLLLQIRTLTTAAERVNLRLWRYLATFRHRRRC
jgi:hypothetical protein